MNIEDKSLELLIRIDERLKSIKDGERGDIPEIKRHLQTLNSGVSKNTTFRKVATWFGTIFGVIIIGTCCKVLFSG